MNARGRGRGISNQPAWMTRGEHSTNNHASGDTTSSSDNLSSQKPIETPPSSNGYGHGHGNGNGNGSSGPPSRDDRRRYDRDRDRDRDRDYRGRDRGGGPPRYGHPNRRGYGGHHGRHNQRPPPHNRITFNSYEEERNWVEDRRAKRLARKSLFDVLPTEEQVAMEELQKAALASHGPNPNVFLRPEERVGGANGSMMSTSGSSGAAGMMMMQPQQTRHARRLYIGQLAADLTEQDVHAFFKNAIATALGNDGGGEDPVLSVYINKERHFAFVEFRSMDVTTACLSLNGMNMQNKGKIIVKRPNDYNPANAPAASAEFMRKFDVSKLGIVSSIVPDSPNKIFIGGLPYHLNEEQVMELLGAFGKIKAFHLVKSDATSVTSKGYCFVEYADPGVTEVAIMGLNGMDMGGVKVLSAKIASKRNAGEGEEPPIAGALSVTPIVPMGEMVSSYSGGVSKAPSIMRYVDGVDVEALVDVAMGNADVSSIAARNVAASSSIAPAASNPLDIANAALQAVYGSNTAGTDATHTNGSNSSRIVVLHNMVSDEDFSTSEDYEALKDEVKEECEKFGSLISMVIPHPKVRQR